MAEAAMGRTASLQGRQAPEIAVYDLLDRLGIPYWQVDYAPARTMEDCAEAERALGIPMCRNLFLCNRQRTAFYLVVLPPDKPFSTKVLCQQISSSRLSFAQEEHMLALLNILPGAVSPMGLMNDREHKVQLLLDRAVAALPYLGCHPCVNTASVKIAMQDVLERFLPAVGHDYILADL